VSPRSPYSPAAVDTPVEAIINTILESARRGRLIVCAGAGLSRAMPTDLPSGADLGKRLDARLQSLVDGYVSPSDRENLIAVADAGAQLEGGEDALRSEVLKLAQFRDADPDYGHEALAELLCEGGIELLLLWNWDDCVERVDVVPERLQVARSETKLLSTYRSTEFGVPTTTSPPKYSWLGAGGLASELPSGVIADGGATYVPQIASSLQTQGVQPPVSLATQYTSVTQPWVAETLAAGAAQQLLQARQARRALEEANKPPGAVASGGGCVDVECETPGIEGGGGEEGGGANTASTALCEVRWKMHEIPENSGGMWMNSAFYCKRAVPHFELQFCVFDRERASSPALKIGCFGAVFNKSNGEEVPIVWECIHNYYYTGWVWGRIFNSGAENHAYGGASIYAATHKYMQCDGTRQETNQNIIEASNGEHVHPQWLREFTARCLPLRVAAEGDRLRAVPLQP
jgi:hypothetical protein